MNVKQEAYRQRKAIIEENRRQPEKLVRLCDEAVREKNAMMAELGFTIFPREVWRSRTFLVQVYADALAPAVERLSVSCTVPEREGWRQGIAWEELQRLKAECGRGDRFAVEVFPADAHVVNVARMRHLWILAEPPAFAWRKTSATPIGQDVSVSDGVGDRTSDSRKAAGR